MRLPNAVKMMSLKARTHLQTYTVRLEGSVGSWEERWPTVQLG